MTSRVFSPEKPTLIRRGEGTGKRLAQGKSAREGLSWDQCPTRATARPTTELLLRAFEGLTLTRLRTSDGVRVHVTPLTIVQRPILELLDLSPTIYLRLAQYCSEPMLNLSEP